MRPVIRQLLTGIIGGHIIGTIGKLCLEYESLILLCGNLIKVMLEMCSFLCNDTLF